MKFKYELTKKGYRAAYKEVLSRFDIIYYVLASIVFILDMYELFSTSIMIVILAYIAFIIILFLFLKLINIIMIPILIRLNENKLGIVYGTCSCSLDTKKYTEEIGSYKLSINVKDMNKLKVKKSSFVVYASGMILIFAKSSFKHESDYNKLLEKFEKII